MGESVHFISSGRTKSSFELLYQKIAQDGDSLSFYENGMTLLREMSLSLETDSAPDAMPKSLLLLDYALYKGFSDFIFDFLRLKNILIPIVLINPFAHASDMLPLQWISENEFQYDYPNLHALYPILKKINDALKDTEIVRAFENTPFALESEKTAPAVKNPIERMQNHAHLSPSVYNLLNFFYKNRRREISITEIETHLRIASDCPKARKNAAYSYIARLRKCIGSAPSCSLKVLRTRSGHYKLLLY